MPAGGRRILAPSKAQRQAEENAALENAARDYILQKVIEAHTTLEGPLRDEVLEHLTVALAKAQADCVEARKLWTFSN